MFNNIALFGKYDGIQSWETIDQIITFLQGQGKTVFVDHVSCRDFPIERHQIQHVKRDDDLDKIELAIVIGGDGTFLDVARSIVDKDIPLIGINLGRLGFLTDISPDSMMQVLTAIFAGQFLEEKRAMLEASISENGIELFRQLAFNDIVLHKNDSPRMVEFETFIDKKFVNSQRSDGIIISTPTGSSAYSLSAGGPLLTPDLDVLCLVSINPHTMSNRPLVISGNSEVELRPHENCIGIATIICDGQVTHAIGAGKNTTIRRYPKFLRMIHPENHDHFKLLRAKLNWGQQLS